LGFRDASVRATATALDQHRGHDARRKKAPTAWRRDREREREQREREQRERESRERESRERESRERENRESARARGRQARKAGQTRNVGRAGKQSQQHGKCRRRRHRSVRAPGAAASRTKL